MSLRASHSRELCIIQEDTQIYSRIVLLYIVEKAASVFGIVHQACTVKQTYGIS